MKVLPPKRLAVSLTNLQYFHNPGAKSGLPSDKTAAYTVNAYVHCSMLLISFFEFCETSLKVLPPFKSLNWKADSSFSFAESRSAKLTYSNFKIFLLILLDRSEPKGLEIQL